MNCIKANLNKCPLCGHHAHVWQGWDGKFQAECSFCNVRSLSFSNPDKVANSWNSQTKDTYTHAEKKRQKQVTAGKNLGHHLWDYNCKGMLMKYEENR